LEGFNFRHQLRVRYSEIDGQRIVFNSHYMTYIDVAVTEYLRNVLGRHYDKTLQYNGFEIVLVKTEIEFKKPGRFDDVLNIYCKVGRLGNSSMDFELALTRDDGEVLVTAKNLYIAVDLAAGKSRPIPPEIKQCIVDFEGINT